VQQTRSACCLENGAAASQHQESCVVRAAPRFGTLVVISAVLGHDYEQCPDVSVDHLHISSLTLGPDAPSPGEAVLVSVSGTPDVAIPAGTLTADVYLFGVLIPGSPTFDLCKDVKLTCPLAAGVVINGSVSYVVPSASPKGIDVTLKLPFKDAAKADLGCVQAKVTIGSLQVGEGVLGDVDGVLTELTVQEGTAPPTTLPDVAASKARRALLDMQYQSEPAWSTLFAAWRAQHGKRRLVEYASVEEEAKRYQAFKVNIARLHRTFVDTGLRVDADERSDMTHDELSTLAHFA